MFEMAEKRNDTAGHPGSRPGHVLPLLLVIVALLAGTWMAAIEPLGRDLRRARQDHLILVARSAALSGIELARWQLLGAGVQPGQALPVAGAGPLIRDYGQAHFPDARGSLVTCQVRIWPREQGQWLFESKAQVRNGTDEGRPEIRAEVLVKRLAGGPGAGTIVWQENQ